MTDSDGRGLGSCATDRHGDPGLRLVTRLWRRQARLPTLSPRLSAGPGSGRRRPPAQPGETDRDRDSAVTQAQMITRHGPRRPTSSHKLSELSVSARPRGLAVPGRRRAAGPRNSKYYGPRFRQPG